MRPSKHVLSFCHTIFYSVAFFWCSVVLSSSDDVSNILYSQHRDKEGRLSEHVPSPQTDVDVAPAVVVVVVSAAGRVDQMYVLIKWT